MEKQEDESGANGFLWDADPGRKPEEGTLALKK
jgi:hypothetical protein